MDASLGAVAAVAGEVKAGGAGAHGLEELEPKCSSYSYSCNVMFKSVTQKCADTSQWIMVWQPGRHRQKT